MDHHSLRNGRSRARSTDGWLGQCYGGALIPLCCGMLVLLLPTKAQAGQATQLVKVRQAAVFAAAKGSRATTKRKGVQRALRAMFDYAAMARAVQSREWARLSRAQRKELRRLVQDLLLRHHEVLVATAGQRGLRIRFVGESRSSATTIVKASAQGGKTAVNLRYVVRGSRIVDLQIDGSSTTSMLRAQIRRKLRKNRASALLAKLRAVVAKPPSALPSRAPWRPSRAGRVVGALLLAGGATLAAYLAWRVILTDMRGMK